MMRMRTRMSKLKWNPQEAFDEFFHTTKSSIIKNRSVFNNEYEYFVAYGGRGSAKTWTFIDAVVVESTLRPIRVLATRELQGSIEESVKTEIESSIINRGLDEFFHVKKAEIVARNGSKFIFKGLKNNINSLKSIADVDIVICEESEAISKDSWDKLLPSIRPRSGNSPIVIIIFNPDDELDDTYQRFVVRPPPKTIASLINWRDNKFFPRHLDQQRIHCKATRPLKEYENIWEGKPKGANDSAIIDREWVRAARFASKKAGFRKFGPKVVSYDPAGQGRDENAVVFSDGNIVKHIEEWVKSPDLRVATRRAMMIGKLNNATIFRYDECGGFGDGVSVFIDDIIKGKDNKLSINKRNIDVRPFNAGDKVVDPNKVIFGTEKTNDETYSNLKAQAHGFTAQLLYNTFRLVSLGEDVAQETISIDIEDDVIFNKLVVELSSPLWVRSSTNSKKKVESKKDMLKRTNQSSPNIADAFHMIFSPTGLKGLSHLRASTT